MPNPGAEFWLGKNVLVTGGNGFVASRLVKELIGLGANVVVTVRHKHPVSTLRLLDHQGPPPDVEFCDMLGFVDALRLCGRHEIDTIFHLQATSIVRTAARSPMNAVISVG